MKPRMISALACTALAGCLLAGAGIAAPRQEALVAALDAAITAGDRAQLAVLLAPGFRQHDETDEIFPRPIDRDLYIEAVAARRAALEGFSRRSRIVASGADNLALEVTLSGVQRGMYLNQPPSGNHLTLEALEVWKVEDGKLAALWRRSDDIAALRQITGWQPPPDLPFSPAEAREILRFEPGVFLESIAADGAGNLYMTKLLTGRVMKLSPSGEVTVHADLPVGNKPGAPEGIMCLVPGDDGALYASVIAPGSPHHGVWRIAGSGEAAHFSRLPDGVIPNGITRDDAGNLYVADAGRGGVWRIDADGDATAWYTGDLLRRRSYIGVYPPANGIQHWQGELYVANSDRAHIVRLPIAGDGKAGPAAVHAGGVPGDDFAIDDNGILYVTTHPYNSVIRVDRAGERRVIATPEQGVVGPTAAVFARGGVDGNRKLYVVTDGGFYNPLPERPLRPNVVELTIPGT